LTIPYCLGVMKPSENKLDEIFETQERNTTTMHVMDHVQNVDGIFCYHGR
jgi:hypothetical protein